MNTPIFFQCFNRPIETARVLSRIYHANPKHLYILIDFEESEKHNKVCEIVDKSIVEFYKSGSTVTLIKNTVNLGCYKSAVKGIDRVFQSHDKMIMIEDDTLPDLSFFAYAENFLNYYKDDKRIFQVSGNNMHSIPFKQHYGFSKFACCWGWGTWKDRWEKYKEQSVKLSNEVLPFYLSYDMKRRLKIETTWDYSWFLTILLQHGLCVTPRYNLVDNISNTGLHIKRRWGNLNVKKFETFYKLNNIYPYKYENIYYFISQWKAKLKNLFD